MTMILTTHSMRVCHLPLFSCSEQGFACVCPDIDTACAVSDIVGPEHLEIITENALEVTKKCKSYGAVFIGSVSAEV